MARLPHSFLRRLGPPSRVALGERHLAQSSFDVAGDE